MKLVGTCEINRPGLPAHAAIEFDLADQTITLSLPAPDISECLTECQRLSLKHLSVKNISVVSPAGILSCPQLPTSFVSSFSMSGWSLDDGETNKIIAMANGRIQVISLSLTLRKSRMTFSFAPFASSTTLAPEMVLTNHSHHNHTEFSIRLNERAVSIRYSPKHVFVRGKITNDEGEIIRHVCSSLSLGPEQVVSHLVPPKLILNYAWSTSKAYGESLVKTDQLPNAFQALVDLLATCTKEDQERKFNEIIHLVGGFQQSLYVEQRLTNLLKALESFDGTRTMDANNLAKLLQIPRGEADFLCGIRNCMFHHAMSIMEAARKTHSDLSGRPVSLGRFSRVRFSREFPWRIYVTVARLIIPAFFRKCGINKTEPIFSKIKGI